MAGDGSCWYVDQVCDTLPRWRSFQIAFAYMIMDQANHQNSKNKNQCRTLETLLRSVFNAVNQDPGCRLVPVGLYIAETVFRYAAKIGTGSECLQYVQIQQQMDNLKLTLPKEAGSKSSTVQHLYDRLMDLVDVYKIVQPDAPMRPLEIFR